MKKFEFIFGIICYLIALAAVVCIIVFNGIMKSEPGLLGCNISLIFSMISLSINGTLFILKSKEVL